MSGEWVEWEDIPPPEEVELDVHPIGPEPDEEPEPDDEPQPES